MLIKLLRTLETPLRTLCRRYAEKRPASAYVGPWRFDGAVDVWDRHRAVAAELLGRLPYRTPCTVLDVGGIPGLLSPFLPPQWVVVTCNVGGGDRRVCADGSLPAGDREFDAVVSLDTLEHIPADRRKAFVGELRRVSAGPVVLHYPANSDAGESAWGSRYDARFQLWHCVLTGRRDRHTEEHQVLGLPTREWLHWARAPLAYGHRQSGPDWLRSMVLERVPFVRLLAAPWMARRLSAPRDWGRCRARLAVLL